jgi:hypothetical protein
MTKETARDLALARLRQLVPDFDARFAIADEHTADHVWCWVFFWTSRRFLETGDLGDAAVGNAPVAVEKETGLVHVTGTAYPVEHYLELIRAGS